MVNIFPLSYYPSSTTDSKIKKAIQFNRLKGAIFSLLYGIGVACFNNDILIR